VFAHVFCHYFGCHFFYWGHSSSSPYHRQYLQSHMLLTTRFTLCPFYVPIHSVKYSVYASAVLYPEVHYVGHHNNIHSANLTPRVIEATIQIAINVIHISKAPAFSVHIVASFQSGCSLVICCVFSRSRF